MIPDMSGLSSSEKDRLLRIADEIRESMDAEGYTVGVAIAQNPAFADTRVVTSDMQRSIVMRAARRAASQLGSIGIEPVGTGLDLVSWDGIVQRRYRVKSAPRSSSGEYKVVCGAGSTLLHTDVEDLMWPEERWILGYNTTDDHAINEIFAAEIIDHIETESGPVTLVLGPIYLLTSAPTPSGFTSSDESLEGFEDFDDFEDDAGTA